MRQSRTNPAGVTLKDYPKWTVFLVLQHSEKIEIRKTRQSNIISFFSNTILPIHILEFFEYE
jgi:hypothetical protein